jgi:hypothetical protein
VSENPRERTPARALQPGSGVLTKRLLSLEFIGTSVAVITLVVTVITPSRPLKITLGIVAVCFILFVAAKLVLPILVPAADPKRNRDWKLGRLARDIEKGPPGQERELRDFMDSRYLVEDLAVRLGANERLCVVRLTGEDTLEVPPGIADDAIPQYNRCQVIVGEIGWQLEKAPGLKDGKGVAQDLREAASYSLTQDQPMEVLRQRVKETLREWKLAGRHEALRFVPLTEARREALESEAGRWLLGLFQELGCTYGVFMDPDDGDSPPPFPGQYISHAGAQRFVSWNLRTLLSETKFKEVFAALCEAAGDRRIDLELLRLRCAVIVAAAEFNEEREPLRRLLSPEHGMPSPADLRRAAALEVRWLVGRKAARIAGVTSDLPGAFDRLAVTGLATPKMFAELMRDLGLGEDGIEELRTWLDSEEFRAAGITEELRRAGISEEAEGGIRLGKTIRDAALDEWLKNDQPAAYQDAQIASERCYRVCLVLDRTNVPGIGYAGLVAEGYGGLHLYEIPDWWKNVHAWRGHVAEITSPDNRKDAGIAIVCLFLEAWWWWGDQLRLRYIDDVVGLAKDILREQPEWIAALDDFDTGYEPALLKRADADAGDRWAKVASALDFIAGQLGVRQDEIPADPVLARIYICWCFFGGDVAQYHTGDVAAGDRWFADAARACGDDPDNEGMRAFAYYQQADVWIPSDTDRSLRLIEDTHLQDLAGELKDLSLRAYIARMYGDIRWTSGDLSGAFDAYGRALLLTYVYQVDQETDKMPPNTYSCALYSEMRTRFADRIAEARGGQHGSEADAAIERIRALFDPYWAEVGLPAAPLGGDDPLAVVPPMPDQTVLETFESDYAKTAQSMLNDKLDDEVAKPVDEPLPPADDTSEAEAGTAPGEGGTASAEREPEPGSE